MAIVIKDTGTLMNKYVNRATNAVNDYKTGAQTPKRPQAQSAIDAAGKWQSAVSSTLAMNRFTAGLRAAGDQGWQNGVQTKGAAHYADGIRAGQQKWATNVQPYLDFIKSIALDPAGIRGSDANIGRVTKIAAGLHSLKVSRAGTK
jgi:hypothetical protein